MSREIVNTPDAPRSAAYGSFLDGRQGQRLDRLHIAKIGDRWFIVKVLWEVRQGGAEP